ncbi:MAG TPA: GGDEF domain-containing protein [Steroidobacteraceae bacterium]|nr:GGDEF domain-containing protein [Steroidobacteraceae bacterium]
MKPDVEAHLRSLVNFPSPPGVATHIIELARNPEIEMTKVAKALSMDSALSTKILRIANSPLYAQRRKSENLRQALVVLGLNATLTLALSFSLVKALRAGKSNGISYPFYWRRALLAATAGRALADAMHQPMAEEIFLAALLQDVGMLALDQVIPDLYSGGEALQRDHMALAEMEMKRLQTDHAQVGGWLMRIWDLPDRLHLAIGHSHRIDLSFTTEPNHMFERCVALSGPVADLFLLNPEQRQFAETAQSAERSLGLDKMAFGQVLGTVGAMIPETEAIFESEPLAAQHPELILEQAREVLVLRSLHALREINALRAVAESSNSRALELEEETRRDPLTGVYNRAHLDQVLAREFASSTRHKWPLSIAFADLDNFKKVNDKFGHQAGDLILQATARILRGNTRETDFIARYVGELFVVVLPTTDATTAHSVCERIVTAFESTGHAIGSDQAKVTVSIGCATHDGETAFNDVADFVRAADQALYAAKLLGRNCAVAFDRRAPTELAARRG